MPLKKKKEQPAIHNTDQESNRKHHSSSDFLHDSWKKISKYFIATYSMPGKSNLQASLNSTVWLWSSGKYGLAISCFPSKMIDVLQQLLKGRYKKTYQSIQKSPSRGLLHINISWHEDNLKDK